VTVIEIFKNDKDCTFGDNYNIPKLINSHFTGLAVKSVVSQKF